MYLYEILNTVLTGYHFLNVDPSILHDHRSINPIIKKKSCYNPLRLGTVIVLVSSGIHFCKYSTFVYRATG